MGNVVEFPTRDQKEAEPTGLPPINIDCAIHDRRVKTTAAMRARILTVVHDILRDHGPDKNKRSLICVAFIMALRDIAYEAADPIILRTIVEALDEKRVHESS